jgi:hypothetical protein
LYTIIFFLQLKNKERLHSSAGGGGGAEGLPAPLNAAE